MADIYFNASFGDLDLLISRIDTDDGRDIAVQSPARGSRHSLQDRGAKFGRATAEILFISEPGKSSFLERFDAFRALIAKGEPQIFSHPLVGSYRARAEGGGFGASSASKSVTYNCVFLPEDEPQPITPTGAGSAPVASPEAVAVAAARADQALAGVGLSSSVPTEAAALITSQAESEDVDPQAVFVGVATMTERINTAVRELELLTTVERWPAYQAMIGLMSAVRFAGDALTATSASLLEIRVDRALPMIAICAQVYGAELAAQRAEQATRLNRVRAPNRVPVGTVLKLPREGAR